MLNWILICYARLLCIVLFQEFQCPVWPCVVLCRQTDRQTDTWWFQQALFMQWGLGVLLLVVLSHWVWFSAWPGSVCICVSYYGWLTTLRGRPAPHTSRAHVQSNPPGYTSFRVTWGRSVWCVCLHTCISLCECVRERWWWKKKWAWATCIVWHVKLSLSALHSLTHAHTDTEAITAATRSLMPPLLPWQLHTSRYLG